MANKLEWNSITILKIFYSLLALGFVSTSFVDDQPYCALRYRRLCQGKGRHVGCQYPYPGPGVGCLNYTQIKFTAKLRQFIINYINRRRQRVAAGTERVRGGALIPKPQIMMMVVWDRELALLAQRLADQCSFIHDDCRATVRYPYSGQTVGEVRWRGSSSESDTLSAQRALRRVFDAWWGERRRVQPQQLIAPFRLGMKGSAWGHFSQLAVWALSAAGCGAARHGNPRRLLLVCDFSHTNMLGQSTLTPGELVPCPAHFTRKSRSIYPLLCAPIRIPDHNSNEDNSQYGSYEEYAPKFADEEEIFTSSVLNTKATHTETQLVQTLTTIERKLKYQGVFKNATKPLIINKLEQELEMKRTTQYTEPKYIKKLSTQMYFGDIREDTEKDFDVKEKWKMNKTLLKYYFSGAHTNGTVRRKWKHTRQRPRRPGADALISKPVEKILQRASDVPWSLDREGMEQLFQDTGFHKQWRKESLP